MTQRVFVSNSSPWIAFERLERLDLLQRLTGMLFIPPAVRMELFGTQVIPVEWVIERPLKQPAAAIPLAPRLGAGEREAIALALEMSPCYLLMDDLAARRAAQSLGLVVSGVVGLLILARQHGWLPALRPALDTLRDAGFHISDALYQQCLQRVNEK